MTTDKGSFRWIQTQTFVITVSINYIITIYNIKSMYLTLRKKINIER